MKAFATLLACIPVLANAQTLVGTAPQDRTVLLEEYAAVNCGNCPASHVLADDLLAQYPTSLVAVEVHGGSLAVPSSGQPDFRNEWATGLWSFYGVNSQPRGSIDRIPIGGQVVTSTGNWYTAISAALALASPVNLGLSSTFDPATRELTVNVELYYTADGTGGNDRISVLLKEDHIIGYQQDYVNGPQAAYDHENILRAYLTDLWGDEVAENLSGSLIIRSYTLTIPEDWNIANCDAVAFVSEYQDEIYQARSVAADGGFTTEISDASAGYHAPDRAYPVPASGLVVIPLEGTMQPTSLRIRDAVGRFIKELPVMAGEPQLLLDVSGYPNGTYFYTLEADGMSACGRLVVAH